MRSATLHSFWVAAWQKYESKSQIWARNRLTRCTAVLITIGKYQRSYKMNAESTQRAKFLNPVFFPSLSVFRNSPREFTANSAMLLQCYFRKDWVHKTTNFVSYLFPGVYIKLNSTLMQFILHSHVASRCQVYSPHKTVAAHVPYKIEAVRYNWHLT